MQRAAGRGVVDAAEAGVPRGLVETARLEVQGVHVDLKTLVKTALGGFLSKNAY